MRVIIHKQREKNKTWCNNKVEWNTIIDKIWKNVNCSACYEEALKDKTRTSYDVASRWFEIKKEKGELV